ncbi:cytochrome P450 3A18 [Ixodes scapularis]|uniref:cytochrome P450 3A18 n=1 Tax=Ixodes scapularis TaxID=6945 RepID=UPI001A9E3D06|nr:cytochrome P450 3A18 [Ixodes scapularis]
MGTLMWNALVAAVVALVTCVAWWIRDRRRKHSFFKNHGILGPEPGLLWGNRKELKKDAINVMENWIEQYGKVFGFYQSEVPFIALSDVEIIKQCFIKESNVFHDRPSIPLKVEPFASSLPFLNADTWKKVRTVLNPTFSAVKMKQMMQIMNACTDEFVDVLDDYAKKGKVVDMFKVAQGLSLDVITKCALAWQVDSQRNPHEPLLREVRNIFLSSDNFVTRAAFWFPSLNKLIEWLHPFTKLARTLDNITQNLNKVVHLRRSGISPDVPDMLQLMLDAQTEKGSSADDHDEYEPLIEDRLLIANCFIFLLGGFDTTAVALAYIMHILAKYPEEQDNILREITEAFPDKKELGYDEIHRLKRLEMVISESLRLYPVIVTFVSRNCQQDITVMGQFIPAGANVTLPVWHLHHSAEHWPDPLKFDPERFNEDKGKPHVGAYLPFGLGPRACIGKRFAMLELKATVCKVLRSFRVVQCEETQDPLKVVVPNATAYPKDGVKLKLELRNP